METVDAWHYLPADRRLRFGARAPVVLGEPLRLPDGLTPALCATGFHASVRALDALNYVPAGETGIILCRVRLGGTIRHGDDKLVASERTVLAWTEADPILHEAACQFAEGALLRVSAFSEIDPRSLRALQVKRAWLRGEATDADLDAARAAAWDAAWDAARDAAWDAARAAARAAAWDAANDLLERLAYEALGLTEEG